MIYEFINKEYMSGADSYATIYCNLYMPAPEMQVLMSENAVRHQRLSTIRNVVPLPTSLLFTKIDPL